jgi:2-keto-4-pentenoate hydratase
MRLTPALLLAAVAAPAAADCPTTATALAEGWLAREVVTAPQIADAEEAVCIQSAFTTAIGGVPVGWRLASAGEAGQAQAGLDAPVVARLLDTMIVEDATAVPRDYAADPVVEAGMLLVVRDAGIMAAETHEALLAAIEAFQPMIALGDRLVAAGAAVNAHTHTAMNAGTRYAVAGERIAIDRDDTEWIEALASMTVRVEDETGTIIGDYPGASLMGHPLDAVLWLVAHLEARGEALEAGDLVALGGFGPVIDMPQMGGLRVTYLRLPDDTDATALALFD